ncbi:transcriptional regulator, DeoR family [Treponema socranskii subsp. socranskii VPI DR56BR1116 = ATCC 35536]|uniref:Transcriptional regulator, DeoR family n=2 Tax=Treponema socranskii subsp. socranskii VPI DR56BR1116 = ATCC 35536 TaxID=1125725 RepID=A0ABP2YJH1_TRESO|nr:transcriptional regulator, DeoR family [Treponema socranskii subsp. socranskii VPI DR56BR1116 = ATCC 35536]
MKFRGKMNKTGKEQSTPKRRDAVYQLLQQCKIASAKEISKKLHVSEMTIRRDFEYLENKGLVERTHGGTIISNRYNTALLFSQKNMLHIEAKQAIARSAAAYIQPYDTIFLNSGTTTMRIFPFITAEHVKIITNNPCIPLDEISENIEVISTGGIYNTESLTLVGGIANTSVGNVWATKSFIGIDGIDVNCGLTTPVEQESYINRLMIEHTRGNIIIVADSSKIGKISRFRVAPITSIHILITDTDISNTDVEKFTNAGIQVIKASFL